MEQFCVCLWMAGVAPPENSFGSENCRDASPRFEQVDVVVSRDLTLVGRNCVLRQVKVLLRHRDEDVGGGEIGPQTPLPDMNCAGLLVDRFEQCRSSDFVPVVAVGRGRANDNTRLESRKHFRPALGQLILISASAGTRNICRRVENQELESGSPTRFLEFESPTFPLFDFSKADGDIDDAPTGVTQAEQGARSTDRFIVGVRSYVHDDLAGCHTRLLLGRRADVSNQMADSLVRVFKMA